MAKSRFTAKEIAEMEKAKVKGTYNPNDYAPLEEVEPAIEEAPVEIIEAEVEETVAVVETAEPAVAGAYVAQRRDPSTIGKGRKSISYEKKQGFVGFMFILPWFLGFLFFFLQPLVMSLNFSLSDIDLFNNYATTFNGGVNYLDAIKQPKFFQNLSTTLTDLLVNVPIIVVFSLFVAVLLNRKFIGRGVARAIFFLPVIVTTGVVMKAFNAEGDASAIMGGEVASGILFEVKDVTSILQNSGLPEGLLDYMTQISNRIFDVVWDSGIQILLFLAALQGISPSLYEASDVEGATGWETFWLITFPSVSPLILVNVVYTIIDTFSATDNPLLGMINDFINQFDFGLASALSWMYFVVIFIIIGVVYAVLQKMVHYSVD